MIGRIITRGRNSGLKCLSTGSLPPFPSLSSLFFPKQRACSQASEEFAHCNKHFPHTVNNDTCLWLKRRTYPKNKKHIVLLTTIVLHCSTNHPYLTTKNIFLFTLLCSLHSVLKSIHAWSGMEKCYRVGSTCKFRVCVEKVFSKNSADI